MKTRDRLMCTGLAIVALSWGIGLGHAQYVPPPPLAPGVNYSLPNYANSPVLTKFVDPLPGVKAAGAAIPGFYFNGAVGGKNIPVAVADTTTFPGSDYYEIALVDYTDTMHSELGSTKLRGYVQIEPPGSTTTPVGSLHVLLPGVTISNAPVYAFDAPTYLGPIIVATKGQPTRVKFYNLLTAGGKLFIPTDLTVDGAGTGPDGTPYPQTRATLHLHGGDNPWISDGTAHQWITPAGEPGTLLTGVSQQNVPDMSAPGPGAATFFWPNGQSGRLMFYHDHAYGITRLNVYAGEAGGYLLVDGTEATINALAPGGEIPLVIQDKGFVSDGLLPATYPKDPITGLPLAAPAATLAVDPLWGNTLLNPDAVNWGQTRGSLWWPHVYMPNQNPNDLSGANPMGRVDYGAWFWPVFPSLVPPTVSTVPEGFMDTPVINGAAYPKLTVDPTAYRFRILNACNDRFVNLQLYVAASNIVGGITVAGGGSGYTAVPKVTITPAAGDTIGQGATAVATIDPVAGTVTAVTLSIVGSGYTLPPVVTIAPPTTAGGVQATATATLYTAPTEVGMVPADINSAVTTWPAGWAVQTPGMIPDIIDNRPGGLPDPRNIGPDFIQIGSEGGLLPASAVLPVTPIGYVQNKRDITVGSVGPNEHTLFLGCAERADVIIDFSGFAGKTLILYSDSPAPVPAGDPRNDYYTWGPDMTGQGGVPPPQPGFGPNTRTLMQITVGPSVGATPVSVAAVDAALAAAWTARGEPLIVPNNPQVVAAKISDTSLTGTFMIPDPITGVPAATTTTLPLQPKCIQELFDTYGRMNATLGVEIPFTTATIQTTIPYGFTDPATEVLSDGVTQLWKITHNGVDTHPVHFHLFNVQLVNRVGWDGAIRLPEPNEMGWKETVRMNPLEDIIVALHAKTPTVPASMAGKIPNNTRPLDPAKPASFSFTGIVDPNGNPVAAYTNASVNFGNEYTWHCHILGHEENDMMRPVMVAVKPATPTLNPFVISKGNLVLSWNDPSPDETAYMVQKRTIASPTWTTIATVPAGTTTYTDANWKSNQGAQYQVIAVNTVGSGVLNFPSVTAYSLPSNLQAAPLGATTITSISQALAVGSPVVLRWTYSATDATGFTIQRSTSNTFPANSTVTTTVGNVLTYSDTSVVVGLRRNTTYYYRVTPTNANGSGAPSNIASLLVHP